jgi:hypothetical protein
VVVQVAAATHAEAIDADQEDAVVLGVADGEALDRDVAQRQRRADREARRTDASSPLPTLMPLVKPSASMIAPRLPRRR